MHLDIEKFKKVHFIGIGGISMSGLAQILQANGHEISGSDAKPSEITEKLKMSNCTIYDSHSIENIINPDLVVYTAAIAKDNIELLKAKSISVPVIERAVLLGAIMDKYPFSIAVSGTHGKTTTTSMVSSILLQSEKNPTIHIGGELEIIKGSTYVGDNKYFVAEACEYVESFLKFNPFLAIILNIEADHLDYFKDLEHVKSSFVKFANKVAENGYIIANKDDKNIVSIIDNFNANTITYSISDKTATYYADNIKYDDLGHGIFDLYNNSNILGTIQLDVPGIHNISNAVAACATSFIAGCSFEEIRNALKSFGGAKRRFQFKGIVDGIKVIDDYAHHPTEIRATLTASKNGTYKNIWCVFQPHTYTRTKALMKEFSSAFENADKIVIPDIYAAREPDTFEINSSMLVDKIIEKGKDAYYIKDFYSIIKFLDENVKSGDLLITMGAGDVYKIGEMFIDYKMMQSFKDILI